MASVITILKQVVAILDFEVRAGEIPLIFQIGNLTSWGNNDPVQLYLLNYFKMCLLWEWDKLTPETLSLHILNPSRNAYN